MLQDSRPEPVAFRRSLLLKGWHSALLCVRLMDGLLNEIEKSYNPQTPARGPKLLWQFMLPCRELAAKVVRQNTRSKDPV